MKKIGLILSFLFCFGQVFGQSIVPRSNNTITVMDSRWMAGLNLFAPRYTDTTAANLQKGIDSCGALIYTYDVNNYWVRKCSPKHWAQVGAVQAIPTWQETLNESSMLLVDNVIDVNSTNLSFNNAQSFTVYNDAASTTRLKLSPSESDLFPPNGATGLVVTNALASLSLNTNIAVADSVGTRFTSNWTTGSLPSSWSDATPTTTLTFDGTGMTANLGAFDLNNHIDAGFFVGVPNWTIRQKVVVLTKNSTSFGFGFRFKPNSGNGSNYFAHFLLADTTGYLAFNTTNSLPVSTDPNNRSNLTFQWAASDTLELVVQRQGRTAIMSMKNLRTGITSSLSYSAIFTGTCNLSMMFYGGQFKFINSLTLDYNEVIHPTIVGLGNSIMYGANADNEALGFFALATSGVKGGAINMGHSAEGTLNGIDNLGDILTWLQPHYVLVEYGVNESNSAINLDSFGHRLRRLVSPMIAQNIGVIMLTCVPQTGSNTTPYNDTIKAVAASLGARVADVFTGLVATSGTAMNSIYNSGDGTHPNNKGDSLISGLVYQRIRDVVTIQSPLNVSPIPNSSDYKVLLGLNANNDIVGVTPGATNLFIQNISATTNPQVASFDITGHAYIYSEIRVLGTGGLTNPNFSVNKIAPGYTDAQLFNSQNLTTSSNTVTIDGASSGRLNFTTDPAINSISTGLHFFNVNATGTYGIKFDDNGGGLAVSNPSYHPVEIYRNNGSKFLLDFNRGGGGDFDSLLKYTHPMRSIYDNLTLVDKRYVDSSVAAGGGFVSPLTTTGDIIYSSSGSTAARLGIGSSNQVLTVIGGIPSWQNSAAGFSNPMTTAGDIITGGVAGAAGRLAAGTNTFVLTMVAGAPAWAAATATTAISGLGVAGATNDIDNTSFRQRWRWTTLAGDTAMVINSTNTTAASNAQVGGAFLLKGANATSSQTTKALYVGNTKTGTGAIDIGLYAEVGTATTSSRAAFFNGGISIQATDLSASHIQYHNSGGTLEWREASAALTGSGNGDWVLYNGTTTNGGASGVGVILDYQTLNFAAYGGATTLFQPSAKLHAASGNTAAGTAPVKLGFITPVLMTTPERYALEIDSSSTGGNIYYDGSNATRYTIAKTLTNTATLDFGSTAGGGTTDLTITVTGAADGDAVTLGVPNGSEPAGTNLYGWRAWVSSANTVTIRLLNMNTVTAIDPASGSFRVAVLKY